MSETMTRVSEKGYALAKALARPGESVGDVLERALAAMQEHDLLAAARQRSIQNPTTDLSDMLNLIAIRFPAAPNLYNEHEFAERSARVYAALMRPGETRAQPNTRPDGGA